MTICRFLEPALAPIDQKRRHTRISTPHFNPYQRKKYISLAGPEYCTRTAKPLIDQTQICQKKPPPPNIVYLSLISQKPYIFHRSISPYAHIYHVPSFCQDFDIDISQAPSRQQDTGSEQYDSAPVQSVRYGGTVYKLVTVARQLRGKPQQSSPKGEYVDQAFQLRKLGLHKALSITNQHIVFTIVV